MNLPAPLISIVVPVYNVDPYLDRCLTSLANQTYPHLECVLVDDGSTDRSPEICDKYSLHDDRFRVVHQKNTGVSAARNAGLNVARGEYISFVDADDWIEPSMVAIMFNAISSFDTDIAVCDVYTYDKGKVTIRYNFKTRHENPQVLARLDATSRILGSNAVIWNKLFKRRIISDAHFDTRVQYGEDLLFLAHCCENLDTAVFLPQPLYYYHISRDGNVVSGPVSPKSGDLARVGSRIYIKARQGAVPLEAAVRRNQIIFMELSSMFMRTPLRKLRSIECRECAAELAKLATFLRTEATNRKCRIFSRVLLVSATAYHIFVKLDMIASVFRSRLSRSKIERH